MTRKVVVRATGRYVPSKTLNNKDFEKIVDTTDEWIVTRTGIRERHFCLPPESNSTMAEAACRQALDRAGVKPEEIDVIVLATVTPEKIFPATACILQGKLGAKNAIAWDVNAACSGFIYALSSAHSFLLQPKYRYALVVGCRLHRPQHLRPLRRRGERVPPRRRRDGEESRDHVVRARLRRDADRHPLPIRRRKQEAVHDRDRTWP